MYALRSFVQVPQKCPVLKATNVKLCLLHKCSAVVEMGDRLATTDKGQTLGAVPLFGGGSWVPM